MSLRVARKVPRLLDVQVRCRTIYSAIVEGHLALGGFDAGVAKLGPRLVEAMLELHRNVMHNFLPSAIKFHYQFNLRELSNITQARPPPCVPDLSADSGFDRPSQP